jgi:small subunit ribosomal protein S4
MVKRNFPPGIHGSKGYGRLTDYGIQLKEKQKAKKIYRLMENQFKNYFFKAHKTKKNTENILLQLLEMRLDNVIYRAGFAKSRNLARQLISHNHFLINDQKVNIPSYQVKVNDIIKLKEKSINSKAFANIKEQIKKNEPVSWLSIDPDKLEIKIVDKPSIDETKGEFDPKLIIEFYSR